MFVVAAEFLGASEGLGFLLIDGQQLGKPAQIVAAITAFAILGKATDAAASPGARRLSCAGKTASRGSEETAMLVLDRIGKTCLNGVRALDGISLEVDLGEIVAVVGGSGCGKSTLLRAISGLDTPSQGRVVLDGDVITAPHEKIGIIFQEPRLLPWLTVAGNVGFGLEDRPRPERRERVAAGLERVGLSDKAKVWPRNSPADRPNVLPSLRVHWCRVPRCCCSTNRSRARRLHRTTRRIIC